MSKELTIKQEAFCQAVLIEKTQTDAYKKAYPISKNWKPATVHSRASELMSNSKVMARLTYLKAKIEKKVIDEIVYSKKEHFDELNTIKTNAIENKQLSTAGKMVENKGKLCGYYEDIHKHIGDKNAPIQHKIIIEFIKSKRIMQ